MMGDGECKVFEEGASLAWNYKQQERRRERRRREGVFVKS
jgi:hypothetical protein